ncbi:MAG: ABC transporter permease [Halobacteriaceae archaeon]
MLQNRVVKRALQAVFTVYVVVSLTFGLIRLMPGGPMDFLRARLMRTRGGGMTTQQINALVETYLNVHPDRPLWKQYVNYMVSMAQGDMGKSLWYNKPVADIIGHALPWTMFLMSTSILFTFMIGVTLGAFMAYNEGGWLDTTSTFVAVFLNSVPYYVAAILFVYVLGYQLSVFPTSGRMTAGTTPGMNWPFLAGAIQHAALPVASLVLTGFGFQALSMRGNSIRILGEDYLRVARLRGVPSDRIALRYVGRNAILPMYTGVLIAIGFMFGGSVILERIFNYPGLGYYLFKAIQASDYPLMMGDFILITIAVVVGVFVADMTYGLVDPRADTGGEGGDVY